MRTRYSCITALALCFMIFSCKKDQVHEPLFDDITSTPCKLLSYNGDRYRIDYTADNKLDKINEAEFNIPGSGVPSGYKPMIRFQYEDGYLKRILNVYKENIPGINIEEAYTKTKFDYGSHGIKTVSFYTTGLVDARLEYTYDNQDKPTSMIYYTYSMDDPSQYPLGSRTAKAISQYEYTYDDNGNIIKEIRKSLVPNEDHWDYIATFKYDQSVNAIKLLETFIFSLRSAPWIFSKNNLVESEYLYYNDSPVPGKLNRTEFDANNNIYISTNHYALKWTCN